jgi:hypothetical protein
MSQNKINFLYHKYKTKLAGKKLSITDLLDGVSVKHYEWLVRSYGNDIINETDLDDIKHLLNDFPASYKFDILKVLSYSELVQHSNLAKKLKSIKSKKRENKSKGTEPFLISQNYKVFKLLTEKAAILYGKGTTWCTNGISKFFQFYNSSDTIYLILIPSRKFQFHYSSEEFRNEEDKQITQEEIELLSQYPEHELFLNMMIEKYYLGVK